MRRLIPIASLLFLFEMLWFIATADDLVVQDFVPLPA